MKLWELPSHIYSQYIHTLYNTSQYSDAYRHVVTIVASFRGLSGACFLIVWFCYNQRKYILPSSLYLGNTSQHSENECGCR